MIRIRIGERWKSEATSPPGEGFLERAYDALGIEVDGVEVSGGVIEDLLFPTTTALVEGVTALLRGTSRTSAIPFADGAFELLLARQDATVTLSLVALQRPTRVLVRDLAIELDALVQAIRDCADQLLRDASEFVPGSTATPIARRLAQGARKLALAAASPARSPAPGPPAQLQRKPPRSDGDVPSFGFDLRDEDGRIHAAQDASEGLHPLLAPGYLYVHGRDGEELCVVAGAPFLLLRDLSEAAYRMLTAARDGERHFALALSHAGPTVDVDLHGGACTIEGRTLRCPSRALARAIFEATLDLAGALGVRNPRLTQNPYLRSLTEELRERLALCSELAGGYHPEAPDPALEPPPPPRVPTDAPPIAAGVLRKLALRPVWRAETFSIRSVHPAAGAPFLVGERELIRLRLSDGAVRLRVPLPEGAKVSVGGPDVPLLVAEESGRMLGISPKGRFSWLRASAQAGDLAASYRAERAADVGIVVADGGVLLGLSLLTGVPLFRLAPPTAVRIQVASAGRLAIVASDSGMLYGFDLIRREVIWRLRVGMTVERVAIGTKQAFALAEGRAGVVAIGVDATTGQPTFTVELDQREAGTLLAIPGGVLVSGVGSTGGELLQLDGTGRIRFRARPLLGARAPVVTRTASAIYARGDEGISRIERGRIKWSESCGPGGAPLLTRGVLALPGETLTLLEATSGRRIEAGSLAELPAADHLFATRDGLLVLGDHEGSFMGLRISGALAVVQ